MIAEMPFEGQDSPRAHQFVQGPNQESVEMDELTSQPNTSGGGVEKRERRSSQGPLKF